MATCFYAFFIIFMCDPDHPIQFQFRFGGLVVRVPAATRTIVSSSNLGLKPPHSAVYYKGRLIALLILYKTLGRVGQYKQKIISTVLHILILI